MKLSGDVIVSKVGKRLGVFQPLLAQQEDAYMLVVSLQLENLAGIRKATAV